MLDQDGLSHWGGWSKYPRHDAVMQGSEQQAVQCPMLAQLLQHSSQLCWLKQAPVNRIAVLLAPFHVAGRLPAGCSPHTPAKTAGVVTAQLVTLSPACMQSECGLCCGLPVGMVFLECDYTVQLPAVALKPSMAVAAVLSFVHPARLVTAACATGLIFCRRRTGAAPFRSHSSCITTLQHVDAALCAGSLSHFLCWCCSAGLTHQTP